MKRILLLFVSLLFIQVGFSQFNFWSVSKPVNNIDNAYQIQSTSDLFFEFDLHSFRDAVQESSEDLIVSIPINKSEFVDFKLTINTTMSKGLMKEFPSIRAFNGEAMDGSGRTAKIDISPNYFRAMIFQPGKEDLFIDPAFFNHEPQSTYVLYSREQYISTESFSCHFESELKDDKLIPVEFNQEKAIQSCELRTYRLAISATGEYTIFHGGTVASSMAAQVATMNRVNGIYERDLAITMTMIPNNNLLIFTDPLSDPFTNGTPSAMISENITVTNDVIGESNYDIGHVFGTNSGGLAYRDGVCYSYKAGGVTGSGSPIGDPFDVDYVAHEMGHQFGASHTFNNACGGNRSNTTAMEPGSGSTIMAYAGICPPNVQSNSDGYFHAISLQEIGEAVTYFFHTCAVITPLNNVAPIILTPSVNINVPVSTPFIIKVDATDADGDVLTYTFEQMDRGIAPQPPLATSIKGPNFRTLSATNAPYRYFPSINNLISNTFTWERLSDVARMFEFRVTVRDNAVNGGCTENQNYSVTTIDEAGPFVVTHPNTTGIVWDGLTQETITWDVANTSVAPISCQNVRILFSDDWGATFSTLVESAPNTGSLEITVPNVNTDEALIMVQSEAGTFFDISDNRFKIIKNTVGISEEELSTLTLFPNPTDGRITIDLGQAEYMNGYQIYNTSGQIVKEDHRQIFSESTIDVKELDSGVYFFHTTVGETKRILKLIKR